MPRKDFSEEEREGILASWAQWAASQLGFDSQRQKVAAAASLEILEQGGSVNAAACAAVQSVRPFTPTEMQLVRSEMSRLSGAIEELSTITPHGAVTSEALDSLRQDLQERYEALETIVRGSSGWAGSRLPSYKQTGSTEPARPSFREFFGDNSIQIVSYTGAFLLVVATILFEAYGTNSSQQVTRFASVAGLTGLFAIAGWLCMRSDRFNVIGKTYVAIASILVPLTMVAAYIFLSLRQNGLSVSDSLAGGAYVCAILYSILAGVIRSRAYATLSMLALALGWASTIESLRFNEWRGVAFAPLLIVYVLIATKSIVVTKGVAASGQAKVFLHCGALFVLGWTYAVSRCSSSSVQSGTSGCDTTNPHIWPIFVTLMVLTAIYVLYVALSRAVAMLWIPYLGLVGAILVANASFTWAIQSATIILVLLAWASVIMAAKLSGLPEGLRTFLRVIAVTEVLMCVPLIGTVPWLEATTLLAATALGIWVAFNTQKPQWLFLAGITLTCALGWTVLTVGRLLFGVSTTDLPRVVSFVEVFSILPAFYVFGAILLGRRYGRLWAIVLYQLALATSLGIVIAGLVSGDTWVLGIILFAYSVILYAVGVVEKEGVVVLASTVTLMAGTVSIMQEKDMAGWTYALVFAGISWMIYGLSYVASWSRFQRIVGLSSSVPWVRIVGLVSSAACVLLPIVQLHPRSIVAPRNWVGLTVVLSLGLILALEAWARKNHGFWYLSVIAISLSGFWVARIIGASNPQLYIFATGATLTVLGVIWPNDRNTGRSLSTGWIMSISGSTLLLATTAVQALGAHSDLSHRSLDLDLLAGEGVVWIMAGIIVRSRPLVVSGAVAVGISAVIALIHFAHKVPVYTVFGLLALILLGLAIVLVFLREHISKSWASVSSRWQEWA